MPLSFPEKEGICEERGGAVGAAAELKGCHCPPLDLQCSLPAHCTEATGVQSGLEGVVPQDYPPSRTSHVPNTPSPTFLLDG